MNILLTGAAGYIGSHVCLSLLELGHNVICLDNLSNSSINTIKKLEKLSGKKVNFFEGDLLDKSLLNSIFKEFNIKNVMHFAALKSVEESISNPLSYYKNNVNGTINLLECMESHEVRNIIFSSSATVYGTPAYLPIDENHKKNPINPYGKTKLHVEQILEDIANSSSKWKINCLRYFNPVGSHPSNILGDSPSGIPSNLMPYISMVANGKIGYLKVFGDDYKTHDGTGIRDYIHIMDLVDGHIAALENLKNQAESFEVFNLGTGQGFSVLDMLKMFEKICGKNLPYKIEGRRGGDVAECFACVDKVKNKINWQSKRSLKEMCQSAWDFQKNNTTTNE
jgi:UDP-glucose 4-epimerase